MPKVVDHQDRRAELAQAMWRVALRDGMQAATVRAVAEESGWSSGTLRHYFTTKSELLAFAMDQVVDTARRRIQELDPDQPSRDRLHQLLESILPLDEQRTLEAEVWFALTSHARVDPALRRRRAELDALVESVTRTVIKQLAELGLLASHRDPELELTRLHALVDGLTLHGLAQPPMTTPEQTRAALTAHLDDLAR